MNVFIIYNIHTRAFECARISLNEVESHAPVSISLHPGARSYHLSGVLNTTEATRGHPAHFLLRPPNSTRIHARVHV